MAGHPNHHDVQCTTGELLFMVYEVWDGVRCGKMKGIGRTLPTDKTNTTYWQLRKKHHFNYFHLLSNMRAWSNFSEILTKDCQSDIVPVAWKLIGICWYQTSVHKLICCGNTVDHKRGWLLELKVSILAELVCYLASTLWGEFGGQVFRETVV